MIDSNCTATLSEAIHQFREYITQNHGSGSPKHTFGLQMTWSGMRVRRNSILTRNRPLKSTML